MILFAKLPPGFVVFGGLHWPEKTSQRHLSINRPKGRKAILSSAVEQQRKIGGRRRNLLDEPDLLQVFGRDGEGDGIADGFMKTVVGAIAKHRRLSAIGE